MTKVEFELLYCSVDEQGLNRLIGGEPPEAPASWRPGKTHMSSSEPYGVLLEWNGRISRPLVIVADDKELRRLFGRLSQLRSDFAPLTAWCQVVPPRLFEAVDDVRRSCDLGSMEAAWAGLAIAEAQLLSRISLSSVRIAACLATQAYAIARVLALWPQVSFDDVSERYLNTRRLLNSGSDVGLTGKLYPIWRCLHDSSGGRGGRSRSGFWRIRETIERLQERSSEEDIERVPWYFAPIADLIPGMPELDQLAFMTPEQRLRVFDGFVRKLSDHPDQESEEYHALALVSGYLSTIAAGGAPSLGLAENHAKEHPAILAWAYVSGGLGEKVTWTSSFEGLGRLVVRELMRPLHFDEPPVGDFCFAELTVLADPGLSDPLVHLNIKQARTVSVSLFPGCNVTFSLSEQQRNEKARRETGARLSAPPSEGEFGQVLELLAAALAPHLRERLSGADTGSSFKARTKPKKRTTSASRERKLPFS